MYSSIKETQKQNEKFNEESQKMIDEYERDIKYIQNEKEHLQKINISNTEERDKAVKDYNDILGVIKKLDESRFIMNKLMGPDGALNQV
jgi:chromosome segregation ATPase